MQLEGSNHRETFDTFSNRHGGSAHANKPKGPRHMLRCRIREYKNRVLTWAALTSSVWMRKLAGLRFRRKNWEITINCSHKWRTVEVFLYIYPAFKKCVSKIQIRTYPTLLAPSWKGGAASGLQGCAWLGLSQTSHWTKHSWVKIKPASGQTS